MIEVAQMMWQSFLSKRWTVQA